MIDLAIVLPCLNEADNLRGLLPRIRETLRHISASSEIFVIDGGSHDDTVAVAEKLGAHVILQRGSGYGGAIKTAFEDVEATYLLTMDADFSHHPVFIRYLYERRHEAEIIIASRYTAQGHAEMHWMRKMLSGILNVVFRNVLALDALDLSSGFRLYHRKAVARLNLEYDTYAVLQEILVKAYCQGYQVKEEPFHYLPRRHGSSHARLIEFGIVYLRALYSLWVLRNSSASADYETRAFYGWNPWRRSLQRQRYRVALECIGDKQRILDVGCGASQTLNAVPQSIGVDIRHHKLRFMRRPARSLINATATALPFTDAAFEVVIASRVLEHVADSDSALHEFSRCLESGGILFVGTGGGDEALQKQLTASGFEVVGREHVLGTEVMVKAKKGPHSL
ncbi:MAG: glycosyltransferase [Candidatus Hydrogenedentes bacterium]|nr:glycosyltransferase [Candidatus Hydrogenedentota bacterium]